MAMQAWTLPGLVRRGLPPTYASKYLWSGRKSSTTFWSCGAFCAHHSPPLVSSPS